MHEPNPAKITVIDSPEISIHKIPAQQLAVLAFKQATTSEKYKQQLYSFISLTKQDHLLHWLIYCSKNCVISTDNHFWTAEEWIPKVASELHLLKIAIIESMDISDRISLMELCQYLTNSAPVEIQFFELERNAKKWLAEGLDFDVP